MTFRSDDEKDLLTQFLAWLIKKGLITVSANQRQELERVVVEEFLKARKIE